MTRVVWVVMIGLILAVGIPAVLIKSEEEKGTFPEQEAARAVLVPTTKTHRIIVPPCGPGVPVAQTPPDELARTPGSVTFLLRKGAAEADRVVLVPRCRAGQGAAPSEGVALPAAAFVLPTAAQVEAGRGGSAEAGTELVQSQLVVPVDSPIENVVVPACIEELEEAKETATGRAVILDPQEGRRDTALAPPC